LAQLECGCLSKDVVAWLRWDVVGSVGMCVAQVGYGWLKWSVSDSGWLKWDVCSWLSWDVSRVLLRWDMVGSSG
jgi:hypothetical protein